MTNKMIQELNMQIREKEIAENKELRPIHKSIVSAMRQYQDLLQLIWHSWPNEKPYIIRSDMGYEIYDNPDNWLAYIGYSVNFPDYLVFTITNSDLADRLRSKGVMLNVIDGGSEQYVYKKIPLLSIAKERTFVKQCNLLKNWIEDILQTLE